MTLQELLGRIEPADQQAMERARQHWRRVAKPLGALGTLEDLLVQIAGITGTEVPPLEPRAVAAFCADNGVVEEGVTQCGQEVTGSVARNMAAGCSSVCRIAAVAGAKVFPVDIGMVKEQRVPGLQQSCVRRGTANFTKGPAMTRAEAEQAILVGAEKAVKLHGQGYRLLAAGEMGIGNTTTSSAVVSVLLGVSPAQVTGRGAGLSSEGLARKISAIQRGIALNQPDPADPVDVLSKVGGLDLGGMAGFYLGCAMCRVPVILDGLISYAAALLAVRLCPAVRDYLIPSHCSEEPASRLVLAELGMTPVIQAGMRLGEGTGAVALMPLLDMTLAVYQGVPSFAEMEMEAYRELQ